MTAIAAYVAGLAFACGIWANAYVLGRCANIALGDPQISDRRDEHGGGILVASCLGLAIAMFALFVVGWFAQLRPIPIVAVDLALLALATASAARRAGSARAVAHGLTAPLREMASPAWIVAFAVAVVLAYPALLPPDAFDATMYHYAHAVNWAHAGSLRVDPFLRFPLAQFNIELLDAVAFAFHRDADVGFIAWMTFAWSVTGIASVSRALIAARGASRTIAGAGAMLASLGFATSPLVLRYADVGYVDIAAGALLLGCVVAMADLRRDSVRAAIVVGAIGGAIVGTKTALVPLGLVFATVVVVAVAGQRELPIEGRRRAVVSGLATLLVFAVPWSLRGLAIAGDPFDPVFNLALRHRDPFWSAADLAGQAAAQHRGSYEPAIPLHYFLGSNTGDYGASLAIFALYVPFIVVLAGVLSRTFFAHARTFVAFSAILAAVIVDGYFVSDYQSRYVLAYEAVARVYLAYAVFAAVQVAAKYARPSMARRAPAVGCAILALGMVPSPGGAKVYGAFAARWTATSGAVASPTEYLATHVPGYRDAAHLIGLVRAAGSHERVLVMHGERLAYYFRAADIATVGDWFGPGRYADFAAAVRANRVPAYIRAFEIGAVLAPLADAETMLSRAELTRLYRDFCDYGYRDVTPPGAHALAFARASILAETPFARQSQAQCRALAQAQATAAGRYAIRIDRRVSDVAFAVRPGSFVIDPHAGAVLTFDWYARGAKRVELRVGSPTGALFSVGNERGTAVTGPWGKPGLVFYLQLVDGGEPGTTLATATIPQDPVRP